MKANIDLINPECLQGFRLQNRGIYFLYNKDQLVYIGQSTNIYKRIGEHTVDKTFDSYKILELPENIGLLAVESALINKYKPCYNRKCKEAPISIHKMNLELSADQKERAICKHLLIY